ncbi:hypothetical protein [Burkholderia multivorans]|uniref:hypothetical protein n=1 Tax=Burkholderia multivorans TaxID=87883 RepID=UPI001561C7C2|nr:hypothetical protein [Burkholderia multivorans]MBU9117516.1 hypothetical protein [Burkholderia multivorans]
MEFPYSIQLPDRVLRGSFARRARLFFNLRNDMLSMPRRRARASLRDAPHVTATRKISHLHRTFSTSDKHLPARRATPDACAR